MNESCSSPGEAESARSKAFRAHFSSAWRARLDRVDDLELCDSTNNLLMAASMPPEGHAQIAIADAQTAGRGRHDRQWVTEPGASLCLSVSYTFPSLPDGFAAFALVCGVATARAVHSIGVQDVSLKWPNDIVAHGGKLGGILVESRVTGSGHAVVVAGVGINLGLPAHVRDLVREERTLDPVSMEQLLGWRPERDELAIPLCNTLLDAFDAFASEGWSEWLDEWRELDWLKGKTITVDTDTGTISGSADGVDDDGVLRVQSGGDVARVVAGTIRVVEAI